MAEVGAARTTELLCDDLHTLHDRALLYVGMSSVLRRSELMAVQCEHVEFRADGISIDIGLEKLIR